MQEHELRKILKQLSFDQLKILADEFRITRKNNKKEQILSLVRENHSIDRMIGGGKTSRFEKFEDLLKFGQEQLKGSVTNLTGIEDSLVEPYLSQMIRVNKYIYTTYSTNYPAALPWFQPFGIEGVTKLSTAKKLDKALVPKYYIVLIQNPLTGRLLNELEKWDISSLGSPFSKKSDFWLTPDYLHGDIIAGEETLDYTNRELFTGEDPLVGIFIEDTCTCRKSLYEDILKVLDSEK